MKLRVMSVLVEFKGVICLFTYIVLAIVAELQPMAGVPLFKMEFYF